MSEQLYLGTRSLDLQLISNRKIQNSPIQNEVQCQYYVTAKIQRDSVFPQNTLKDYQCTINILNHLLLIKFVIHELL